MRGPHEPFSSFDQEPQPSPKMFWVIGTRRLSVNVSEPS